MSNLPSQSAVIHNDDNDEQTNPSNTKISTLNSRITSPLIIKRQQNIETEIANNQAYDEIHDLQPRYSSSKKVNNDNPHGKMSMRQIPNKIDSSHELMQGNYYDPNRYDINSPTIPNRQSDPVNININLDEYKKTIAPVCTNKRVTNKSQTDSPPFGDTSESIQQGIAQSVGVLLELNKKQNENLSMKTNNKSHERAVINYFPTTEDENNTKQRSTSSSPASSVTSDDSTSDSSRSNQCRKDNDTTNIPYKELLNEDDDDDVDDDDLNQQTSKSTLTESSTLMNKTQSQNYGTQSIRTIQSERSKCLPNGGYNSHGSSITTKSSSENSEIMKQYSGSDNDEESDEEHYNNSTVSDNISQNSKSTDQNGMKKKLTNKQNHSQDCYSNEQNNFSWERSNSIHFDQIGTIDEQHLQVPRLKHHQFEDTNKLNYSLDHDTISYTSKRNNSQPLSINTSSLSSQQNKNSFEHNEQQYSHSTRTNSRQHQTRTTKKRKQSQQQDIIRTESIPGHRGDLGVDELVMFIDGNTTKQRDNSANLRQTTDANKSRIISKNNNSNDSNSNKTSSKKKSRRAMKNLEETDSLVNDNENTTLTSVSLVENDDENKKTHSITEISNPPDNDEQQSNSNKDDTNLTKSNKSESSLKDWFEQTPNSSTETNDTETFSLSSMVINNSNSEIVLEPFVTVKNRRRLVKERRQDTNSSPITIKTSTYFNTNEKRRTLSTLNNDNTRSTTRIQTSSITKQDNKNTNKKNAITKEEANKPISGEPQTSFPSSSVIHSTNDQLSEKQQFSPRLSSHSSSSSLSSLLKRQSKPPPVVFLNKNIDIELNDVSFGFDLDTVTLNPSSDDIDDKSSTIDIDNNTTNSPSVEQTQTNDISVDSSTQKFIRKMPQRNNRNPQFYSGSDIRPQHQRNYPPQATPQSTPIDPVLLLQYNQRLVNYPQQMPYINLLRAPYFPAHSPYIYVPTTYPTTNENGSDENQNQTTADQIQEPLYYYQTPNGPIYIRPSTIKKPVSDSEQQQTIPVQTVYTTVPNVYSSNYYYPPQTQYFQAIPTAAATTATSSIENKETENTIIDTAENVSDSNDSINAKACYSMQHKSSSNIMSNALHLVYSQQRRNVQTDRFNLEDLTGYLALKWSDAVDSYEQGDNRILLIDERQ